MNKKKDFNVKKKFSIIGISSILALSPLATMACQSQEDQENYKAQFDEFSGQFMAKISDKNKYILKSLGDNISSYKQYSAYKKEAEDIINEMYINNSVSKKDYDHFVEMSSKYETEINNIYDALIKEKENTLKFINEMKEKIDKNKDEYKQYVNAKYDLLLIMLDNYLYKVANVPSATPEFKNFKDNLTNEMKNLDKSLEEEKAKHPTLKWLAKLDALLTADLIENLTLFKKAELDKIQKEISDIRNEIDSIQESDFNNKYDSLKQKITSLTESIAIQVQQINKLKELTKNIDEANFNKYVSSDYQSIKTKISELREEILKAAVNDFETKFNDIQTQLTSLNEKVTTLISKINNLDNLVFQSLIEETKSNLNKQKLEDINQKVADLKAKVEANNFATFDQEYTTIEQEIQKLSESNQTINPFLNRLNQVLTADLETRASSKYNAKILNDLKALIMPLNEKLQNNQSDSFDAEITAIESKRDELNASVLKTEENLAKLSSLVSAKLESDATKFNKQKLDELKAEIEKVRVYVNDEGNTEFDTKYAELQKLVNDLQESIKGSVEKADKLNALITDEMQGENVKTKYDRDEVEKLRAEIQKLEEAIQNNTLTEDFNAKYEELERKATTIKEHIDLSNSNISKLDTVLSEEISSAATTQFNQTKLTDIQAKISALREKVNEGNNDDFEEKLNEIKPLVAELQTSIATSNANIEKINGLITNDLIEGSTTAHNAATLQAIRNDIQELTNLNNLGNYDNFNTKYEEIKAKITALRNSIVTDNGNINRLNSLLSEEVKADGELYAKDKLDAAMAKVTELKEEVNNNGTSEDFETKFNEANQKLTELTEAINAKKEEIKEQRKQELTELLSSVETEENKQYANEDVEAFKTSLEALKAKVEANNAPEYQTQLETLKVKAEEIKNKVIEAKEAEKDREKDQKITEYRNKVNEVKNNVETSITEATKTAHNQASLNSIKEKITQLLSNLEAKNIENFDTEFSNLETSINELTTANTKDNQNIDTLDALINAETRQQATEYSNEKLSALDAKIQTLKQSIQNSGTPEDFNNQLTTLQSDLEALKQDINTKKEERKQAKITELDQLQTEVDTEENRKYASESVTQFKELLTALKTKVENNTDSEYQSELEQVKAKKQEVLEAVENAKKQELKTAFLEKVKTFNDSLVSTEENGYETYAPKEYKVLKGKVEKLKSDVEKDKVRSENYESRYERLEEEKQALDQVATRNKTEDAKIVEVLNTRFTFGDRYFADNLAQQKTTNPDFINSLPLQIINPENNEVINSSIKPNNKKNIIDEFKKVDVELTNKDIKFDVATEYNETENKLIRTVEIRGKQYTISTVMTHLTSPTNETAFGSEGFNIQFSKDNRQLSEFSFDELSADNFVEGENNKLSTILEITEKTIEPVQDDKTKLTLKIKASYKDINRKDKALVFFEFSKEYIGLKANDGPSPFEKLTQIFSGSDAKPFADFTSEETDAMKALFKGKTKNLYLYVVDGKYKYSSKSGAKNAKADFNLGWKDSNDKPSIDQFIKFAKNPDREKSTFIPIKKEDSTNKLYIEFKLVAEGAEWSSAPKHKVYISE